MAKDATPLPPVKQPRERDGHTHRAVPSDKSAHYRKPRLKGGRGGGSRQRLLRHSGMTVNADQD